MVGRRVVAWLALPLVTGFDAFGWYGLRYASWVFLYDAAGMSSADVGWWLVLLTVLRIGGFAVGAAIAAAVAPSVTLGVGGLLLAVGCAAMAVITPALAPAALAVAAFGSGMTVPGLWAAAAGAFARPAHQLRNGLFLAIYAAVQVGAGTAGAGFGLFSDGFGSAPWFVLCAAAALVGTGIAVAAGVAHWFLPAVPERDLSRRLLWGPVGVALGTLALALVPWNAWWVATERVTGMLVGAGGSMTVLWVQPWLVLGSAVCGVLVAVVLHALRVDVPALLWVGMAFVFGAVGMAVGGVSMLAGWPAGATVALVLLAGAEAPANALLVSRIAGDVHWRLSGVLVGLWLTAGMGTNMVVQRLLPAGPGAWEAPVVLALAGVVGVFGGVMVLAAFPVQWRVLAPLDAQPLDEAAPDRSHRNDGSPQIA